MSIIDQLRADLDPSVLRTGSDISDRHLRDWYVDAGPSAAPLAVVLPRNTTDIATVLRACCASGTPVVPQGGLTGLVGGAVPIRDCVVISLERMNTIEEVDPVACTITVQAGAPLQKIQETADAADLLFPLDIGSRGSCQIGGNISTNAGGNRVLRYGMARDLVLGLEVVLADGTVLSNLNKMLKNNTAYDLKQLFIGAEGTLGVVTRLVLRTFPKPRSTQTALCAFAEFAQVYMFLRMARAHLAASLSAFELMWPAFYERAITVGQHRPPLPQGAAAYVLIESMGTDPEHDPAHFAALIEAAIDQSVVSDAVIAQSIAETQRLWAIRDMSGPLTHALAPVGNYDVSIETGKINAFRDECTRRLQSRWADAETICFGHLADSNLHMFVTVGERPYPGDEVDRIVYDCVGEWAGSISAEHGIGVLKRDYLSRSRSEAEIDAMRRIKQALDPRGILNPGKVI